MHLAEHDLETVRSILRRHLPDDAKALVYGSRVHGRNLKTYSDLDVCLSWPSGSLPSELMTVLAREFEDSDLPIVVDIVDWSKLQPEFQAAISTDLTPLKLRDEQGS